MAQSNYLRRVNAIDRNSQVNDVQRGLQAGEGIGKSLSGFANAILAAKKDQIANQLMNQTSPGQTQDLGQLPGGDGSGGGSGSGSDYIPDPDPDPVQINQPGSSINPDFEPEYDFQDMPDLSDAAKQQRVASALQPNQPSGTGDFTLNPSDYSGGGSGQGTVGGLQVIPAVWQS